MILVDFDFYFFTSQNICCIDFFAVTIPNDIEESRKKYRDKRLTFKYYITYFISIWPANGPEILWS